MDIKIAQKKIDALKKEIEYHNKLYYKLDKPEISDYEYDMLYRQLEALELAFPQFITKDSPTQKIGSDNLKQFKEVKHHVVMQSLHDCFSYEELQDFDLKLREKITNPVYVVEPKIDGLSVSIEYKNGILVRASTRGDGYTGEDITDNIRAIESIPNILKKSVPFIEVRGEIYMSEKNFLNLVKQQELNGEKIFKNPRNAAAGSLRQKDPKITASRNLDIFIFNIQQIDGQNFSNHIDSLRYVKSLGLKTVPFYNSYENINEVINQIKKIGESREKLDFPLDGAVIKLNNFNDRDILGSTSKFPRWAQAFKYPPEEKQTTLIDIEVNVGRTGTLTPIGIFAPITLAGTTVSRATLHNADFIREKDIRLGDTVLLRKAGEIIPEVVKSIKHAESSKIYEMPLYCPSCNATVKKQEGMAAIKCINSNCPAQLLRKLIHFVSRDAMNIDGLGQALLSQLVEKQLLESSADIYTLEHDDIANLERMGKKSAENIISAINSSKKRDLSCLIYALGIEHIGSAAAKILAEKFKNLENIRLSTLDEIEQIDGFGEIMAKSVVDFFSLDENQQLLNKLEKFGVNTKDLQKTTGTKLANLTFVLTGTLDTLKRSEAAKIIQENGGKVSNNVSSRTDYVLAGDSPGSKLEKARNLGIKIINEKDFFSLIM